MISGPLTLSADPLLDAPVIQQSNFWDFLSSLDSNSRPIQSNSVWKGAKSIVLERAQLLEIIRAWLKTADESLLHFSWKAADESLFVEQFEWSQKKFAAGELRKTVPLILQSADLHFSAEHLALCLRNLISKEQAGWSYGFWQNGAGFLGHSPELIADWSSLDGSFLTAALAGTFLADVDADLAWKDHKTLEEHQIVVQDMHEQILKEVPSDFVFKKNTQLHRLQHLSHFKTDFVCQNVSAKQSLRLVHRLHPTAALGLYPRHSKLFEEFSQLTLQKIRKQFAAPFTWIQSDRIFSVGMIRNFFFDEKQVQIFSGCGVTQQSHLASELIELRNKRNAVKKMMGFAIDE